MGIRNGARGGSGPGGTRRGSPLARTRSGTAKGAAHAAALPPTLARRARLRIVAADGPSAADGDASPAVLAHETVYDLLADWLAGARGVHAPETLDGCDEYVRYLDDVGRVTHDAEALCRELRTRLAAWIDVETHAPPPGRRPR
jgi:hypothetical protein